MNRRSELGLTIPLVSLLFGRLGAAESGVVSLWAGGFTITLACFGGALLAGVVDPDAVPDEELDTRATLSFAVLIIGGVRRIGGYLIGRVIKRIALSKRLQWSNICS